MELTFHCRFARYIISFITNKITLEKKVIFVLRIEWKYVYY